VHTARYQELNKQYKEAVHTIADQKELIMQLECDLLSVNALPTSYRGQGEVGISFISCYICPVYLLDQGEIQGVACV